MRGCRFEDSQRLQSVSSINTLSWLQAISDSHEQQQQAADEYQRQVTHSAEAAARRDAESQHTVASLQVCTAANTLLRVVALNTMPGTV